MPVLQESTLNRLRKHMMEHDCGTITAWRKYVEDDNGAAIIRNGKKMVVPKEIKIGNNHLLKTKLFELGYGNTVEQSSSVIKVMGKYEEDGEPVSEVSFFVIDLDDQGNLKKDLMALGEEMKQDSIMFAPKGGQEAFLIGTYHRPESFIKYHEEAKMDSLSWGKQGEFMTMVRGRPFYFYTKQP
jgi:hypothetical protein